MDCKSRSRKSCGEHSFFWSCKWIRYHIILHSVSETSAKSVIHVSHHLGHQPFILRVLKLTDRSILGLLKSDSDLYIGLKVITFQEYRISSLKKQEIQCLKTYTKRGSIPRSTCIIIQVSTHLYNKWTKKVITPLKKNIHFYLYLQLQSLGKYAYDIFSRDADDADLLSQPWQGFLRLTWPVGRCQRSAILYASSNNLQKRRTSSIDHTRIHAVLFSKFFFQLFKQI